MRFTGSSQRSRERTEAPSCRRVAMAPSSRSSIGPWPMTATKLLDLGVGLGRGESANLGATNGDAGNFYRRAAHTHGDALAVFATGPDAVGEGYVVPKHGYLAQCFGPVSDKIHPFEGGGDFSVLDQVALRQREHEVSIGNVDLAPAEGVGVDPLLDRRNNLLRVVGPTQEHGVGHARHRRTGEALPAPVAGGLDSEMLRGEPILEVPAQHAVQIGRAH